MVHIAPCLTLTGRPVVKRWSPVCDHLTEIPPFCWLITACYCCKLFGRGRLAVALHYTEIQAIFSPPPEISMMQRASFPLGWTPLTTIRDANFYEIFSR